jgi:branched-chain amino acid transport system substrate-binding protein
MKKHSVVLYGLLFIVLLAVAAGGSYAADKAATIKIGLLLDLTGPIGPGGIDMQKGINLAREKLGDTVAGKKIEFIVEDNGSDAGISVDKAKKLVETDKVALIIGPINGGGTVAVGQYVERVHVPRLDGMGTTNDGAAHDWSFGAVGLQVQEGFGSGVYAHDVLNYKTAVALAADFVPGHYYIEGFKRGFEGKGGKVIQETYYPEGTSNVVPFLTALKQADVFMYWGTPGDCFAMYPQYRELNIKMPIVMPEDGGVLASPGMLKNLGQAAIGAVFGSAYLYNANSAGNKEFVEAYQQKYKESPGVMSGVGYQHMQLVMAALKACNGNTKSDVLYKAIKGLSVDTVRGRLYFPADQGGFGTIANYPNWMGKVGPNFEIIPILPVDDIHVKFKDGKWLPYVAGLAK